MNEEEFTQSSQRAQRRSQRRSQRRDQKSAGREGCTDLAGRIWDAEKSRTSIRSFADPLVLFVFLAV